MVNLNLSITGSLDPLKKAMDDLKSMEVYVGIPEEKSSRPEEKEGINNAELAFIHTNGIRQMSMREEMKGDVEAHGYHKAYDMYIHANGSPLWQSPPRPIIEPAIEDDKENISELMSKAIQATIDGDKEKAEKYLEKAGLEGQKASQDWFTNPKNGWAPNSEETIKRKGSSKPLIDTGELRKAITYVIRKK